SKPRARRVEAPLESAESVGRSARSEWCVALPGISAGVSGGCRRNNGRGEYSAGTWEPDGRLCRAAKPLVQAPGLESNGMFQRPRDDGWRHRSEVCRCKDRGMRVDW